MTTAWLLALDTSTGPCSVALLRDGALHLQLREEGKIQQARRLVPMIEEALAQAGIWYQDLSGIVTTVGPGSFTGLRVGLATARAIGLAANLPVQGVTTLAAQAYAAKTPNPATPYILSLINAGKKEAYYQWFSCEGEFTALDKPLLGGAEAIVQALAQRSSVAAGFTSILADSALFFFQAAPVQPEAAAAGLLAYHHPECCCPPEPLYIRPPDAKPSQRIASPLGSSYDQASIPLEK